MIFDLYIVIGTFWAITYLWNSTSRDIPADLLAATISFFLWPVLLAVVLRRYFKEN